jgi:glycosyltransferase involved in cell wall biosynthesis
MYQTLQAMSKMVEVHLIALLDYPHERAAHEIFREMCASSEFMVRVEGQPAEFGAVSPHAIREFNNADLEWLIHRQILLKSIDVLQLEYLPMGQYAQPYKQIGCILFEHDIYFQSISRQIPTMNGMQRASACFEYLRALRYELKLLPKLDRVQVCSKENKDVVVSYLPKLKDRLDDNMRAGIDTSSYEFKPDGREANTMLFLGNFRHLPNTEALSWFANRVLPLVLERRPEARLVVVGSDPPPRHFFSRDNHAIEMRGFVPDTREPLSRYAIFVCPILGGSGMRVKLLEAFAAGIPCVSTRLGAEGLATTDGEVCALADDPADFAEHIIDLLDHPEKAVELAHRARAAVLDRDMTIITKRLVQSYRDLLLTKRSN